MESEPEPKSKLPIIGIVSVLFVVVLFSLGQNVIRHIELESWDTTEGTVTIYEPYNHTFWYNYSVDGIEYTEWRHSFSWDDQPSILEVINSDDIRVLTSEYYCTETTSFSLTSGQTAYIHIRSTNNSGDFVDVTSTAGRVQINHISINQSLDISTIYNEPGNTTDFHYAAPGDYTIHLSNQKQRAEYSDPWDIYVQPQYAWACIGNHYLTIEMYDSGFVEGDSVTVHYDPDKPDFAVLILPNFSNTYLSIAVFVVAYVAALVAIFRYKPKPKEDTPHEQEDISETKPETEPEPEPEPEIQTSEEEEASVNGDGSPLILIIIGIVVAVLIIKSMAESGSDFNFSGGSCNGLELCLAPLAGAPALGRSNSGKFTDDKKASTQTPLKLITYCLHIDTQNGKKCRRMVYRNSGLCYMHQDSNAAEEYLKTISEDQTSDVLRFTVDGKNHTISSKDIDGLISILEKAKRFWIVDLAPEEAEFAQFTFDGDIDGDGKRDGVAVFEHWKEGRMISKDFWNNPQKLHPTLRLRVLLMNEEPESPENPRCEEIGFCEYDDSGRCFYCFSYSPEFDESESQYWWQKE